MNKHYTNSVHATTRLEFICRLSFPGKTGVYEPDVSAVPIRWINGPQFRCIDSETRLLYTTDPARNRVTLGSTLSYVHNNLHADIRVNYEKIFP